MRRTLALAVTAVVTLAACGSDSSGGPVLAPNETLEPVAENGDTSNATVPEEPAPTAPPEPEDTCIPEGGEAPEIDLGGAEPPPENPDKPEVEIPAEAPTELVRTVLTEGSGVAAAAGDTVIVDYIGVRSDDGLPFDNSYDRAPFPVVLGAGNVIQGWDDGLVGAQAGERVQLDIPSDLAYGEAARSDIICANEDLTFVVDVRVVVPAADPADEPSEPGVDLSTEGVDDTIFDDLTAGDGAALELGDTAVIRYVNFRGDNGVAIESNWASEPLQVPFNDELLAGLFEGLEGMKVGGRRAITIPPEDGFGEEGNPQAGLPAGTDMIFVIDLLGAY